MNVNEQVWSQGPDSSLMNLFNAKSNITVPFPVENGDCYFLAQSLNKSQLIQLISVDSFSVLIGSGQAWYNMSAYMGCSKEQMNRVWIEIDFLKNNHLWIDTHEGKIVRTFY